MTIRALQRIGVAALVFLQACGGSETPTSPGLVRRNNNVSAVEPFAFTLDGSGRVGLSLAGINGSVIVTGGPAESAVTITGEREVRSDSLADAQSQLAQLQVEVQDVGPEVVVRTRQPQDSEGRSYIVNYQLQLPASIEVQVATVNGSLDLSGLVGDVSANLVNGSIEAGLEIGEGGLVELTTVNGEIAVHLPRSTSAAFSAQVVNGTIALTDLVLRNEVRTRTSLRGTLGAGEGTISLRTTNGAIRVDGTP